MLARIAICFSMLFAVMQVRAESCDTDCHKQCRVKTKFPPLDFIEPTCHAKCLVVRQAACAAGTKLPTLPLTPREQFETLGTAACAAPFEAITGAVIARCSNWDGRIDDQHLILQAVDVLQGAGIIQPSELNGVQIRWCPLQNAHGMAPDRGRIYLDTSLKGNAFDTASTLAHEVVHIRQYRRLGSEKFKCFYSREYANCGGCQNRRNLYEREAYDFEDKIRFQLSQTTLAAQAQQPQWAPPAGFPVRSQAGFPSGFGMQVCGCWGTSPPTSVSEPRCSRGAVRINACPGFCPAGGNPYAYVCQ